MARPVAAETDPTRPGARRLAGGLRLVVVGLLLSVVGACGAHGPARSAGPVTVPRPGAGGTEAKGRPTVDVADLVQIQTRVLVDGRGYPLYVYLPDHHRAVTCAGECAQVWPPVFGSGARVALGPGVRPDLIGTDPDPVAGTVVTYDHWPLYTYAEDPQPGFATGQGLDVDGGYWYLIRPDGRLVVPAG